MTKLGKSVKSIPKIQTLMYQGLDGENGKMGTIF